MRKVSKWEKVCWWVGVPLVIVGGIGIGVAPDGGWLGVSFISAIAGIVLAGIGEGTRTLPSLKDTPSSEEDSEYDGPCGHGPKVS